MCELIPDFARRAECRRTLSLDGSRAEPEIHARRIATYAGAKPENVQNAVFLMAEIFEESARFVAARLEFAVNAEESGNIIKYLEDIKNKGEDQSKN